MEPAVHCCTGCGARVVFGDSALSKSCSYCDSPMVDDERASAAIASVVPFRVPRRGAAERLRVYLDGRRWAPAALREVRIHERALRGVMVPFWVYDGVVRSDYRAKVGLYWYRSETYTDEEGKTRERRVRETEWFPLRGTAARQIEDHVVSASVGLPESEANALAPFDLGWASAYDPRVLSGFEAELPTVASARADRVALEELREAEATRIIRELLPGDVNRLDRISSQIEVSDRRLVLLPVWIVAHRQTVGRRSGARELVLRLLVNGQTGQVIGRVPVSKKKVALLIALVAVIVAVIVALARAQGGPW